MSNKQKKPADIDWSENPFCIVTPPVEDPYRGRGEPSKVRGEMSFEPALIVPFLAKATLRIDPQFQSMGVTARVNFEELADLITEQQVSAGLITQLKIIADALEFKQNKTARDTWEYAKRKFPAETHQKNWCSGIETIFTTMRGDIRNIPVEIKKTWLPPERPVQRDNF